MIYRTLLLLMTELQQEEQQPEKNHEHYFVRSDWHEHGDRKVYRLYVCACGSHEMRSMSFEESVKEAIVRAEWIERDYKDV